MFDGAAVEEAADLVRATIVEPNANVSGSTSVACWLEALVYGSALTRVSATFAWAGIGPGEKSDGRERPEQGGLTAPTLCESCADLCPL